ncbi:MAG: polymer-forming cytoskeletal protein [Acidobacteriota bacterium]|nr:polymer-forming cytoskeletal protein [Acidobacteriota bacterium]
MWKKNEPQKPEAPSAAAPPRAQSPRSNPAERRPAPSGSGQQAFIGPSVTIEGKISGDEDLVIQGTVDGDIAFRKNKVTIGSNGRAHADVHGRSIHVEGTVVGNLYGTEEVILHDSGNVEGNITAPRVSLQNGAQFKGSIDMEPKRNAGGGSGSSSGGSGGSSGGSSSKDSSGSSGSKGGSSGSGGSSSSAGRSGQRS